MCDLKALMKATERALDMAADARNSFKHVAVNWAHRCCVDAQLIRHADGTETHAVIIEEADPVNTEFQTFIAEELAQLGFPGVEVVTEW